jgi:pyruvate dehydrogenase E1 component alpha subunit
MRCDGMDVIDTYSVVGEAVRRVREERRPILVEAVTYRFRGHSMADPEQYRTKEEVARWRERDPLISFGERLVADGALDEDARRAIDEDAMARVDAAVEFADASPFPPAESLYDDVYVLEGEVRGWYSGESAQDRESRASAAHGDTASEDESGVPEQLTRALAARDDVVEGTGAP